MANDKNAKYFTLIAGRKEPAKLEMGFLDKKTGQPRGTTQKVMVAVGSLMLPNYSRVWGRRIVRQNGKPKAGYVSVTDKEYKGELELLEWGADGGEQLEIRYLRQTVSLDKQYQDQILKLTPREDDVFLTLNQGINDFDTQRDGVLIEMYKAHSQNADSICRDPNNQDWTYVVYDASKRKSKAQLVAIRNEAESIVLDNQEDSDTLKVLAGIYGLDALMQDDVLVDQLLTKVEENPSGFVHRLQTYKKDVADKLIDLVEEDALDLDSDESSILYYRGGTKEVLLTGIEDAKGKAKITWVMDHILQAEVFDAVRKLDDTLAEVAANK